jgi:glutamate/tyrosine decarboxylase-like PLP-dependent enzyme
MDEQPVSPYAAVLSQAHDAAIDYLDSLDDRPVGVDCGEENLRYLDTVLAGPLGDAGREPTAVIADLARCARRGVVASGGGGFHGLVVGGTLPPAVAADWLVSAWDQCAAVFDSSPLTSIVEQAALEWTVDLLGLAGAGGARGISGGFTQGTTEAHEVAFHIACRHLLAGRGWDAAADGMWGAPPFPVLVSAAAHRSVRQALQYVGIGRNRVATVPVDDQGRMRVDALAQMLADADGPGLLVASAGEINTGSFDPIGEIVTLARPLGYWCHVDGAFGLWAGACPPLRHLVAGIEQADSWATDFHKMLQSTYDGGVVLCRHPDRHHAAMTTQASYTRTATIRTASRPAAGRPPDGMDRVLGMARRARGVPVWAALRSLGRDGVADLIWRCHAHAVRLAELVTAQGAARVANDVVFNQVLLDVAPAQLPGPAADRFVAAVVDRIRADGTCWLGSTRWAGRSMLRVSVASWQTTPAHIERSAAAISRAVRATCAQAGVHGAGWRAGRALIGNAHRDIRCGR